MTTERSKAGLNKRSTFPAAGFTMVEILVVMVCALVILTPLMTVYRTGTRSSLRGMLQMDISQEAMSVLRQVRTDLKSSCFYQPLTPFDIVFQNLVTPGGTAAAPSFSFLCFPHPGAEGDAAPIDDSGPALRRASLVTYLLEPGKGTAGLGVLKRLERFHPDHPLAGQYPGGVQARDLSKRVCGFQVSPVSIQSGTENQSFFWISIKLAGASIPSVGDLESLKTPEKPGEYLIQRTQGLVIADFHDIVSPDMFRFMKRFPGFRRNIHSGVSDQASK